MSDLGSIASPDPGSSSAPGAVLRLTSAQVDQLVAHCLACYPEEGCGLLTGVEDSEVTGVHPVRNLAASAQVYTVDPREHLRIDREAEAAGRSVIGVFHSHTHTDPYPSATDVRQAPDPGWHYVLVSLRHEVASVRSYRIVNGAITEESITVAER